MDKNAATQVMVHKFEKVMNKYNAWDKKPRYYGTDDLLYKSEVHTIEAIGNNNKINVTQLAIYLGITKGAVSQMTDKLIKKGMISKKLVSDTENEVSLELTEKGKQVYAGHEDYHKEFYFEISQKLTNLSDENIQVCLDILDSLENFIEHK